MFANAEVRVLKITQKYQQRDQHKPINYQDCPNLPQDSNIDSLMHDHHHCVQSLTKIVVWNG